MRRMRNPLNPRTLEKLVRGFANHRRIQVLELLDVSAEALSLLSIARECRTDFRVICVHVQRLAAVGLVVKRSKGRITLHDITPMGRRVLAFLRSID